ncbi:proline--tRNA ligase [Leptotrichia sp. OH3620_COT-345]|uniref:proline--tRNA ligase n=1 Tax=Leptotrichia sp. OH3620_COT-345 TaxID=2491048 RepID=UPI000F649B46|nr:proline--tRNA ligase [Leptotrichia sp. OH3620_COT-345]RRD39219.1 proline--tRNA ligase [Leptotrichia sp. OH3620_COT-345]
MKLSKAFLKTYKEAPKEAEVISHQLMLRASMIKQLTRGIYSYLPLGYKVLRKIENIVREEMDRANAQEIHMPVLQPSSLWEETGRWFAYGPELMRLKDRNEREFALGPTHEEVVTDIVRNMVDSYKDLPFNLYQIQTKFRDEIRPRFGLMRGREFLMKDAYSFHIDEKSLDEEYLNMKAAYERIFERCGLNFRAVEADSGSIGGDSSHEFMVLADSGEDDILYCDVSDYAANKEKASSIIKLEMSNEEKKEKELVETPDCKTIEDVANFFKVDKTKTVKAVLLKEVLADGANYFMALIRGDLDINPIKVKNIAGAATELEMMDEEDCEKLGIAKGYVGSFDKNENIKVVLDETVKYMRNFIVGGNKEGYHYANVNLEDIHYDITGDIREAREGDGCPGGKGTLKIARGIEVGHIFKLGEKYSKALNATVLDENGKQRIIKMGCYGIGISRVMAAAIEQNHDEWGIIWPKAIAPYLVDIIIANIKDETQYSLGEKLYEKLNSKGIDVVLDDRNERAGFKFKDADLIGFPLKIVVGKGAIEGKVEIKDRRTGESQEIKVEEVTDFLKKFIEE